MTVRQMKVVASFIALLLVIVGAIVLWNNESVMVNRPAVERTASEPMKPTFENGSYTEAFWVS